MQNGDHAKTLYEAESKKWQLSEWWVTSFDCGGQQRAFEVWFPTESQMISLEAWIKRETDSTAQDRSDPLLYLREATSCNLDELKGDRADEEPRWIGPIRWVFCTLLIKFTVYPVDLRNNQAPPKILQRLHLRICRRFVAKSTEHENLIPFIFSYSCFEVQLLLWNGQLLLHSYTVLCLSSPTAKSFFQPVCIKSW